MFNKIQSVTNRKIIDNFSDLKSLVNYIKSTKREEINHILEARKTGKGSAEYKNIKKYKLPCAIINFNHKNNYVNGSTVTNSTDYLYLDIDDADSLGDIDFNYVSAYWKSLSNNGYSIVVKVNGLTPYNLQESYRYVGNILDINYDAAAISIDRVTVLSYDPNAYYSSNTRIIDLSEIIVDTKKSTHSVSNNIFNLGYHQNGDKIRIDNLNEVIEQSNVEINYNEDGVFDLGTDNKISYSKIIIPFKSIKKGKREKVLSSITHQLISFNKNWVKKRIVAYIYSINQNKMQPPLKDQEVNTIVNKKFKQRNELEPMVNAKRRILYDPNFNLSGKQKSLLALKTCNKSTVEKSKAKIRIVLQNWNYNELGKITQKKVIQITKMNKKTVGKYYTEIITELGINKKSS